MNRRGKLFLWLLAAGALILIATAVFAGRARAHDIWANGEPVPAWVRKACCGPNDVHHLRPEQVHQQADGYHVDGMSYVIPYSSALPSPDGDFWGFWATYSDGSTSMPYCFFAGVQGS